MLRHYGATMIDMPFTVMSVMLPDGREITMRINAQRHECVIDGLESGPCILKGAERIGIRTMLETAFPKYP